MTHPLQRDPEASVPDLGAPELSVVVPCHDEAGNIEPLLAEIAAALAGQSFEIVVIDDGSSDGTRGAVAGAAAADPRIRLVVHDRAAGQSAAIRTGVLLARGAVVATIDGDGQNDPAYLPALVDALRAAGPGTGLAAGQRTGRKAGFAKRHGSRVANAARRAMLGDATRDTGCGLKAMRRDLFLLLPYFDSWHRYFPALVAREGLRTIHVDVVDRERRHGVSKYGILDRLLLGIRDLMGVRWLIARRRVRPRVTEIAALEPVLRVAP